MKKILPLMMVLAAAAVFSACSEGDDHGVIINHSNFFSNLFGAAPVLAAPVQTAPLGAPAPAPEPAKS
jgi:hypothetical protein